MKLLKLEIGILPKEKQFRSLHSGFKVEFHSFDNKGLDAMESFSPFCLENSLKRFSKGSLCFSTKFCS